MARKRNKTYQQGERINIYLSQDVNQEFIDWINSQSDLSSFFLYAAQKLYDQTGYIDVSEIMPRKINFDISSPDKSPALAPKPTITKPEPIEKQSVPNAIMVSSESRLSDDTYESEEKKKKESWANLDILDDDPFA
ncbi:hypothetical protein COJ46_21990 [Bacillus sp. AFS077874]|uniref:hypothetical protein n=1 Tax=Bacillus sp. AFS077874 TaxID=2033513 RepID=UPI000BF58DA7|nr:hypothetical protein [Bacillus sp. AFS077874]PFM75226.1 hypothetical protein COJ46_21990 [Bacillus sp. AFS077874]